jgi:FAD:protein FMN transferase
MRHGIGHAHVAAGGDSRVIGDKRGRPWTIGVRDPRKPDGLIALLPLEDTAISTSGDYERFFERNGVRHHHIVDPATGASPSSVRSVTVLAADGLTCEALSKTVFVLGVQRGLDLIESLEGVDAIVVDAAGNLHYSSGMAAGRTPARH